MKMNDPFKTAFQAEIKKLVGTLRRSGTVKMGADNLWQYAASKISRIPTAPVGINAAWAARQTFNEIISEQPVAAFILKP